jgi:hypothetical protein
MCTKFTCQRHRVKLSPHRSSIHSTNTKPKKKISSLEALKVCSTVGFPVPAHVHTYSHRNSNKGHKWCATHVYGVFYFFFCLNVRTELEGWLCETCCEETSNSRAHQLSSQMSSRLQTTPAAVSQLLQVQRTHAVSLARTRCTALAL